MSPGQQTLQIALSQLGAKGTSVRLHDGPRARLHRKSVYPGCMAIVYRRITQAIA